MFLSRSKKNNVYPCKPQFYYLKVTFKGSTLHRHFFMMWFEQSLLYALWIVKDSRFLQRDSKDSDQTVRLHSGATTYVINMMISA